MLKTSFFYSKVSLKSLYFLVAMTATLLDVFTRLIGTLEDSVFLYTKYFLIPFIFFHIYLLITSSSMMYREYKVLSFLEKEKGRKMIAILLANLTITMSFGLLSVLIILIFKNPLFSYTTVLMGIGHFLIILFIGSFFAITIGISAASIVKNELSIVVSLGVYGLMIAATFGSLSDKLLVSYLQVFLADDTFIVFNEVAGVLFTREYFVDKLVVIFLGVFILSVVYLLFHSSGSKRFIIAPLLSLVACCVLVIYGLNHQHTFYHAVEGDRAVFGEFEIEEYAMRLNLHNKLENDAVIKINVTESSETISFYLDSIFTVKQVKVNHEIAEYTFSDDMLVIHNEFIKNVPSIVEIQYGGRVDMKTDTGANLFYVTPYAVNLVGEDFFWYPSPLMNEPINFNVDVSSDVQLYSNLSSRNGKLQGDATYVSIFAGIYTEQTVAGIRYVYPPAMTVESIKDMISTVIDNTDASSPDSEVLKNAHYNQVIIATWPLEGGLIKMENSTLYMRVD